jgi:hypothetical protein
MTRLLESYIERDLHWLRASCAQHDPAPPRAGSALCYADETRSGAQF